MLTVKRNGSQVEIDVVLFVPHVGTFTYPFYNTRYSDQEAGFTVEALAHKFHEFLKHQREIWYEKGWRDAKSRNKKRDEFPGTWLA